MSKENYIPLRNENEFSSINLNTIAKPQTKSPYVYQIEQVQLSRIQSIQTGMIVTIVIFVLIVLILLAMLIFLIVSTSNGSWNYSVPTPQSDSLGDKIKSLLNIEAKFEPKTLDNLQNNEEKKETEILKDEEIEFLRNPETEIKNSSKKFFRPKNTPHPNKRSQSPV